MKMRSSAVDETGKTYSRLTVLHRVESVKWGSKYYAAFLCQCECGNQRVYAGRQLRNGMAKSCGCLQYEYRHNGKMRRIGKGLTVYNRCKSAAEMRGYPFELTLEEFKDISCRSCIYCGAEPTKDVYGLVCNGIDRLDNDKGYIIGNVVPCCGSCNFKKMAVTVPIMITALEHLGYEVRKTLA